MGVCAHECVSLCVCVSVCLCVCVFECDRGIASDTQTRRYVCVLAFVSVKMQACAQAFLA